MFLEIDQLTMQFGGLVAVNNVSISIKKGETVRVLFTLPLSDLSYYHEDMSYDYDGGEFELYIGPDSDVKDFVLFTVSQP